MPNNKKKRVFVSFEYEPDKALRDLFVGQSKNPATPFDVIDHSLHEAVKQKDWIEKASEKISQADLMIVLVGKTTYKASGVRKEILIAKDLGIKCVQLIGYRDAKCRRVADAGRMYRWTWQNLEKILS